MTSKIMMGTDPEFFMRRLEDNKLISAVPFIAGGKHDPIKLEKSGGTLQHDNVAVEFSTVPANSPQTFVDILRATLQETISKLPPGHELLASASAVFDDNQLNTPEAQEFGCTPDYDAWEVKENDSPTHPNAKFRSCGGHLHIGCLDMEGKLTHEDAKFLLTFEGKLDMVKGMDLFLGIISTVLDSSPEAVERKKLYGRAGCHRGTLYGVEYRALSNFWTKSPMLSMLMTSLSEDVVEVIINEKLEALIEEVGAEDIQRIINTGAVKDAEKIIENVLTAYLSEDSKFYLEECLIKLDKTDTIEKEWSIGA